MPPFCYPPGLLVLLLFALAIYCWRKRSRGKAFAIFLIGTTLWTLSIDPTAEKLMSGLEQGLTIPSKLQGDVVLLLGGGIHQDVADLTGKGTPSNNMAGRIITAVRAQKMLQVPIVISGGAVFSGRTPEAPVIRRILVDLGVPPRQVIEEAKSRDTMENAQYCREILTAQGFRRPILVTSAYHMKRSLEAFRKAGIKPQPLTAQFTTSSGQASIWADFLPSAGAFHSSATALREQLGLLFYKLQK